MSNAGAGAVIVAAGSSQRMAGPDKLEALIAGRSVLRWAVEAFSSAPAVEELIVVTAAERERALRDSAWLAGLGARVVVGGRRRQDSVAAGLAASSADIVLVHDAARPFVSPELISRVIEGARQHGAAIPVLPIVDALKRVEGQNVTGTAERAGLYRAQTPQGARRDLLVDAAARHADGPDEIPDEAELLACDGVSVHSVAGEASNIKVTLPEDLALARRLAGQDLSQRLAMGTDSHPFGPADGLRLAGLTMEGVPRLHGHSDGDVVLHALCDGLLAACGKGDLGRLFPSGADATRGIDSRALVAEVMLLLEGAGLALQRADITIVAARPHFGARRLDGMAASIAGLTAVAPDRVSVKAASGNLSGDEGAGRVISATCLVTVGQR